MHYGFAPSDWSTAKEQARRAMVACARDPARGTIAYSELTAEITAIHLEPDSYAFHAMLGEISTAEDDAGRGMLSVVVVHKTGDKSPGEGFYKLATQLERPMTDKMAFWISELKRVHAECRKHA